ncbi:ESPR-type extended signal peptide-containing protein [Dialister succinatiphilus]|jgi:hypothetical protein|uniref:ESPR-type extended signal peptide-containing protein n=1 Tax=Dialister succinatiphilus TaxID=487173 RepID=UPI002353F43A|nr:ESPR-type extended signal peptide-containing protein [Dialister succinatiphilus]
MNRIYKVIWSKVRHCYVVVSELAKRNGKTKSVHTSLAACPKQSGLLTKLQQDGASLGAILAVAAMLTVSWGGTVFAANTTTEINGVTNGNVQGTSHTDGVQLDFNDPIREDGDTPGHVSDNKYVYGVSLGNNTDIHTINMWNQPIYGGYSGIAIGDYSKANGYFATAMGPNAQALQDYSIAIGANAKVDTHTTLKDASSADDRPSGSIAIGLGAYATDSENTVIGMGAGYGTTKQNQGTVLIGRSAGRDADLAFMTDQNHNGWGSVIIGQDAGREMKGASNIAMGSTAGYRQKGFQNILIGDDAKTVSWAASSKETTINGVEDHVFGNRNIILGNQYFDQEASDQYDNYKINANGSTYNSINDTIAIGTLARAIKNQGIAIGSSKNNGVNGALSEGVRAIAIGMSSDPKNIGSHAAADDSIAFGTNTETLAADSIAFGANAKTEASAKSGIAIGDGATAKGIESVAIGKSAVAEGIGAVVIGDGNRATGISATSFGGTLKADNTTNTVISVRSNTASGDSSLAFGEGDNQAKGRGSVAFGVGTVAGGDSYKDPTTGKVVEVGQDSVAFGNSTKATGDRSLAFGLQTEASQDNAVAFGNATKAMSGGATAFGNRTRAVSEYATAMGNRAIAGGKYAVAFGTDSIAGVEVDENGAMTLNDTAGTKIDYNGNVAYTDANGKTYGVKNYSLGAGSETHDYVVVKGTDATGAEKTYIQDYRGGLHEVSIDANTGEVTVLTTSTRGAKLTTATQNSSAGYVLKGYENATAFGKETKAANAQATAFGTETVASGENATAMGNKSVASGANSVAFGDSSTAAAANSLAALGGTVETDAKNAAAIGSGAKASLSDSIALGSGAVANTPAGKEGYDPVKDDHAADTSGVWKSTRNAVSVGDANSKITRQITGVAAGAADTDAVNVAQLKALESKIKPGTGGGDFTLTTSASDGTVSGTTKEQISSGDTVTIDAGKNIAVTQDNSKISIATKDDLNVNTLTAGKDGKDGKDGQDGKEGAIGINGKDGKPGEDGQNYTTTIIKTEKGQPGKDGKDGAPGVNGTDITRIVYTNPSDGTDGQDGKDGKHIVATLDDGMKYAGDNYVAADKDGKTPEKNVITKNLNERLDVIGGATGEFTKTDNIGVNATADGKLKVQLVKNVDLGEGGSVTTTKTTKDDKTGDTTVVTTVQDGNGITITTGTQKDGDTNPTVDNSKTVSLTDGGLSNGGNQITNVASGNTGKTYDTTVKGQENYNNAANIGDIQNIFTTNSTQLPVVYTKADGTKVYKVGDKFYTTLNEDGTGSGEVAATDVIASMNNGNNSTTDAVKLANVGSSISDATGTTWGDKLDAANKATPNNAVNVSDLKNTSDDLINKGLQFGANSPKDKPVTNKLGSEVDIVGKEAKTGHTYSAENLTTTVEQNATTGKTTITVLMDEDITGNSVTVGKAGKDGKDGQDGKEGAIGINGKDGKPGEDGQNYTTTIIKTEKGQPGKDGKDGAPGVNGTDITRIVYTNPSDGTDGQDGKDGKHIVATLDDGMKYAGDDGQTDTTKVIQKKLNEQLDIVGGATGTLTEGNIGVNNIGGKLVVQLAQNIDLGENGTIKAGTATMGNVDAGKATADGKNEQKGNYVIGLDNINWKDGDFVSGRAATEDQLNQVSKSIKNAADGGGFGLKGDDGNSATQDLGKTIQVIGKTTKIDNKEIKNITTSVDNTDKDNPKLLIDLSNDLSIGGKNGNPGTIGVKGSDGKDGVTIRGVDGTNGTDGHIGLTGHDGLDGKNGKDGVSADIRVVKGQNGVDGTDGNNGKDGMTRIVYNDGKDGQNGKDHELATMDDGLKFQGNNTSVTNNQKLNSTVTIAGEGIEEKDGKLVNSSTGNEFKSAAGNIAVEADGKGKLEVKLSKDINLGKDGSVKTGDTTVNNNGVTHTHTNTDGSTTTTTLGDSGISITNTKTDGDKVTTKTVSLTDNGLDNGGNKITNVAAGEAPTDAVNVSQLKDEIQKVTDAHSTVSVGGESAKKDGEAVTGGNLTLTRSQDDKTKAYNYDVKLADNLEIGKAGANGKDGSIGVNGKDGTTIVIGNDGKDGRDGSNGISIKGEKGANGDAGISITGPQGAKGENGSDGAIGIKGADGKDAVSISGKDGVGHIGLTGPKGADGADGKSIDISVKDGYDGQRGEKGAKGVDGKDGITRIVYQDGTVEHQVATLDDGMKYKGDSGSAAVKLNNVTSIVGGADVNNLSDNNIGVVAAQDGDNAKLTVKLNKDITGLNSVTTNVVNATTINTTTIKAGDTTINNEGVTINNGPTITQTKVDVAGNKITNVAPGENATDAVNVGQLAGLANNTNRSLNKLGNRINRVGAGAAALAALHPLDFDPDEKWDFAAGYGNYRGANAASIGAFYRPNEDTMFSIGGSFGGGENMVNAGVSFKVGQGNHVSTSRVAMAKEIKDQRKMIMDLQGVVNTLCNITGADSSSIQAMNKPFPDVPDNHWAYDYVKGLAEKGIIEGYPDGLFKGGQSMTRYEFAAMLYRALQKGFAVDAKALKEFAPELEWFRVDTIHKDKDGVPTVERVRTIERDNQAGEPATGGDAYQGASRKELVDKIETMDAEMKAMKEKLQQRDEQVETLLKEFAEFKASAKK